MDIPEPGIVFRLPGKVHRDENTASTISLISLGMKTTGERSAGKPHAAFDVAGAGNGVEVEMTNFDLN